MISIALFCKYPQHADTDLRLRPLCLGQGHTGRQGEEPHDRSDDDDDDGITGITSRVISSTGRSRLMLPHLTPLSPWLRWKLPWAWRHKSGWRGRVTQSRDTSVSLVTSVASHHVLLSSDLWSWQSQAGNIPVPAHWALQIFLIFSETTFGHQYHFR